MFRLSSCRQLIHLAVQFFVVVSQCASALLPRFLHCYSLITNTEQERWA